MEFCRFLRSVKFVVRSLGRFLGRVVCLDYSGVRVAVFFQKLAHFRAFVVKVKAQSRANFYFSDEAQFRCFPYLYVDTAQFRFMTP